MPAVFAAARISRASLLGIAVAACTVLLLGFAAQASAYSKPAGGKWNFQNLFDNTKRGALSLSKKGTKVVNLVLVPGEDEVEACGTAPIRLTSRPPVVKYRKIGGRYAVANLKNGLFVGKPLSFKQGKETFRAKLELLWDETGRLMQTGQFEHGACFLSFFARKGR